MCHNDINVNLQERPQSAREKYYLGNMSNIIKHSKWSSMSWDFLTRLENIKTRLETYLKICLRDIHVFKIWSELLYICVSFWFQVSWRHLKYFQDVFEPIVSSVYVSNTFVLGHLSFMLKNTICLKKWDVFVIRQTCL